MKRFYTLVTSAQTSQGWEIHLDGRPIKTPERGVLIAPNENIATELVQEWAGQGDEIIPDSMPFTQILTTKIDRITAQRPAMSALLMKYLDTDLVCYRTDTPPELLHAQEAAWTPVLKWFEKQYGAKLQTTQTLQALTQSPEAHAAVQKDIEAMDADHFTILQLTSSIAGSVVLALMFTHKAIKADALFNAIRVEEQFQDKIYNAEKYGQSPSQEKKDAAVKDDLTNSEKYLYLL